MVGREQKGRTAQAPNSSTGMHEKNDATGRTTRRKGTETETVRRQRLFTVLAGRQRGRPNASRAAGSCRLLFRRDGAGAFPCSRCLHATLTHKRCKQPHSRVAIPLPHPHSRRVVAPVHLHQHQSASRRRRRRVCVSVCACKKVIQHASCSITGADGDEAECHQPFFVVVSPVRSLLRLALAFARSRSPSFLIFPLSIIRTWLSHLFCSHHLILPLFRSPIVLYPSFGRHRLQQQSNQRTTLSLTNRIRF